MKQEHIGFVALALMVVAGLLIAKFVGVPSAPAPQAAMGAVTAGEIAITDAWIAAPVGDQPRAAGYITIRNDGGTDERLVGVTTPAAAMSHLHRTVVEDNVSRMESVNAVIIPAHGEVTFAPGGLHLMLMSLTESLTEGQTVSLTLQFLDAGDVTVDAPVRSREDMLDMH